MSVMIKINGSYVDADSWYVKINGEWKSVVSKLVKVDGEWKSPAQRCVWKKYSIAYQVSEATGTSLLGWKAPGHSGTSQTTTVRLYASPSYSFDTSTGIFSLGSKKNYFDLTSQSSDQTVTIFNDFDTSGTNGTFISSGCYFAFQTITRYKNWSGSGSGTRYSDITTIYKDSAVGNLLVTGEFLRDPILWGIRTATNDSTPHAVTRYSAERTQGEYIETVTASSGTYPDNGILGSYWYVLQ